MKTKIINDFTISDNFIRDTISLYNKLHTYIREPELYKVFDKEQIEIINVVIESIARINCKCNFIY